MAPASLLDLVQALPTTDVWGPPVTTETIYNGVPYAPFSKGDKLGRMADWTNDGKNQERGGRQQYNRNYRGMHLFFVAQCLAEKVWGQRFKEKNIRKAIKRRRPENANYIHGNLAHFKFVEQKLTRSSQINPTAPAQVSKESSAPRVLTMRAPSPL